jgi:UDP-3-O-[3-hydroxymyristoyl] glucosamine N-acyltransferase
MSHTLAEIANLLEADFLGDPNTLIIGLSPLNEIKTQHLVFAEGENNIQVAKQSSCAAMIVSSKPENCDKPMIIHSYPLMAFAQLIPEFYPDIKKTKEIHPSACIGKDVKLGDDIYIGPFAIIEDHCEIGNGSVIHGHVTIREQTKIGAQCEIHPNVTIYPKTIIEDKVIIHAGSVIGSDGFGYRFVDGIHHKLPHAGHVIIESNVEIGANTVVDRATLGCTKIGKGSKIDNLVQIAHSVKIGENNIICAFTGIAGSTTSGKNVIFAANVGVSDHVKIDDQVILGARTGVPPKKHLKQGLTYLGNPARPKDKAIEQEFSTTRIPFMRKHIQNLQEKVQGIEEKLSAWSKELD